MVWYTPIRLVPILHNEHRRRVDRCLMPLPTQSLLRSLRQVQRARIVGPDVYVAPGTEADIGRFAERCGRQLGALFQITKKSIFTAAAAGMTAESVLEILEQVCSREVPGNVRRKIQGWFAQCRKVSFESVMLIRCPDRETALRIVGLAKGSAVALNDTVLEYKVPASNGLG